MPVPQGREGVRKVLHEFKHGQLRSGSKRGPRVTKRKQAIAIALNQAGMSRRNKSRRGRRGRSHRR